MMPEAYSFDVLPVPFLRRSWLYFTTNCFDIMSGNEISGVVSHEMAHIRTRDSMRRVLVNIPASSLKIIWGLFAAYLLFKVGATLFAGHFLLAFLRLLYLALLLAAMGLVQKVMKRMVRELNFTMEHLADLRAMQENGFVAAANFLIKIGQRIEAIVILARLKESETGKSVGVDDLDKIVAMIPRDEMDERHAIALVTETVARSNLTTLASDGGGGGSGSRSGTDGTDGLLEAAERERAARERAAEKLKVLRDRFSVARDEGIDWRKFDTNVADFNLDEVELELLMEEARRRPDQPLFPFSARGNKKAGSHPEMMDRVRFLYDAWKEERAAGPGK